jgi:DNA-binding NarL/FixJ family response regulator
MQDNNFSATDDKKIIEEVMKLGTNGYLTKQCAGENTGGHTNCFYMGEEYFCNNTRERSYAMLTKILKREQR